MKNRFIKLLKKIFVLPPLPTVLISVPSYALVIYALAEETAVPAVTYAAYLLSAYALVITMTGITGIVRAVKQRIARHPLVRRLLGVLLIGKFVREDTFRAAIGIYLGFAVNIFYVGVNLFSGIRYRSVWFVTLAVYYMLLAAMRASLLCSMRGNGKRKASGWRTYRLCGGILLLMNAALAGIVILVVYENSGFVYPGMLIYIMAMYAFYATITAVWHVIKFRRYGSPIFSAAKAINLTAALVSMLSLETAMLTQFGAGDDAAFRQMMTACTGAGISLLVFGMAAFMIRRSAKQLRQEREKSYDKNSCSGG